MRTHLVWLSVVIFVVIVTQLPAVYGDDSHGLDCSLNDLEAVIAQNTAELRDENPEYESELVPEYTYQVGDLYMDYALSCGYQPDPQSIERLIERTLELVPLRVIIASAAVGNTIDEILVELETVNGDSFNGQLLYNGLEFGLDGTELGCSGCHTGGLAGPNTEGTYTRVEELRLTLPELEAYSIEQYLVASILHPADYIVPEYANVQMPANYGTRIDLQQLADLIAYLESQDQLLNDSGE